MVIAGIPTDLLLHTRAAQMLLDRGREEGEAQCEAFSAGVALLDFSGPADLAS